MTPQELKNSILQLAIQGKLVPQRAEEGNAEDLYQQIQAEKQKLIKEGKIKKEKLLPPITDDKKPFEIPESWKWVRLKEIVYNHGQITPLTKFSYIDIGSIDNIKNRLNNDDNILEPKNAPSRARKIVKIGDILYSTVRPYLHNICIIDRNFKYVPIASTGFAVMSCYSGVYNKYLFHYLLSPAFDSYANNNKNSKGVAYPAINDTRLYIGIVPLPPLAEQKRIVAKIKELLPYVERYETAYNKLQQLNKRFPGDLQKSVLQLAIQGRLVPQHPEEGNAEDLYKQIQAEKQKLIKEGKIKKEKPLPPITDDEKPFEIPKSWKWVRLGELCAVLTCGYASTPEYVSKDLGMPFLSAKNVKPYKFMPEDHKYIKRELYEKLIQNAKPEKGDILLTRVGAGIGEAAIIDKKLDFAIYVSLNLIKLINYNLVYNKYILFWLNSPIGISSTKSNIYGKNASQGNLNVKNVREFLVPLPTFAEQKRIVTKLEELLPLCNELK